MLQKGLAPVLIIVFITALGFLGYFSYKNFEAKPKIANIASSSPEVNKNSKKYINQKFNYTVEFPEQLKVGINNVIRGEFEPSTGMETEVTFMNKDEFDLDNFLQIQVVELAVANKTLTQMANEKHQAIKSHIQNSNVTDLENTKFLGYESFEFGFQGEAMFTPNWDGGVKKGKFKSVYFVKEGYLFAIHLKDNDLFNSVLNSLKFFEGTSKGESVLFVDTQGRFSFSYPSDWKVLPSVPEEFNYRDYSGRQDWKDFINSPEGLSWWLEGKMFAGECRGPVLQSTLDPRQLIALEIVSADGDGGWCWSTGYFKEDHKWLIQDKYMYPITEDNSGKLVTADWKGDFFKFANIAKNDKWLVSGGLANRETYNLLGESAFAQIITSFKFK